MSASWPRFPDDNPMVVNGHRTSVSRIHAGPVQTGTAVVFVHSALLDRHAWSRTVYRLAELLPPAGLNATLVSYDLRGHGAAATEPIASIDQLAADLIAVTQQVGAARTHVVGLSLGGAVAQAAAVAAPEQFASLALLGTSTKFPRDVMDERAARGRDEGVPAQVKPTLDRWVSSPTAADEVNEYLRQALANTSPARWSESWQALGRFDVTETLDGVPVPILVLAGSRDTASPPAAMELIAKLAPHSRLEYLEAAHLSALERPAEVAAHLADHLIAVDGRP
ncbi:alpha/beta fold hydrolase [Amycolatopsis jiangsuensis]|uniref:3-oxoadipate enol-lactonase n=1 Tax=Amycolatopsis jiangsuensis TaxID=1181879 RepID=A0A840J6C4_9PSEU|nr:alpha/beta hydrolase [Amycolatopsis jiangsuensis]MBB4689580.1 3-oxoadipate enol-lactonase [Amycolatopsis jiangsuensis]